jgi:hypothetical protein
MTYYQETGSIARSYAVHAQDERFLDNVHHGRTRNNTETVTLEIGNYKLPAADGIIFLCNSVENPWLKSNEILSRSDCSFLPGSVLRWRFMEIDRNAFCRYMGLGGSPQ